MLKKNYSCSSKILLPRHPFSNVPLLNITDEKDPEEYIALPEFLFNLFVFVSLLLFLFFCFVFVLILITQYYKPIRFCTPFPLPLTTHHTTPPPHRTHSPNSAIITSCKSFPFCFAFAQSRSLSFCLNVC